MAYTDTMSGFAIPRSPQYRVRAQPFGTFPKGHAQGSESKSRSSESAPAAVSAFGNTISSQPESLLAGSDALPLVDVALNGWAITPTSSPGERIRVAMSK